MMSDQTGMPEGFIKLQATEVWRNLDTLIVLGVPVDCDGEEVDHNCDWMGCGSVGPHVIAIGRIVKADRLQRNCYGRLSITEDCEAFIRHGPGHQSRTRCYLTEPHEIHYGLAKAGR